MSKITRYFPEETFLIILLLIAAALRLINYSGFSYSNDELSAIYRAIQPGFRELVDNGFRIDGHPGGIEVLLYYMIKLNGTDESWIRLPFVIAGILSVLMTYLLGRQWFNKVTGLFAAAAVGFLQFPLLFSQIARPYMPGMLFTLMAAFFWTKLLFATDSAKKIRLYINALAYGISTALCLYDHYFAALMAAIIALSGFVFVRPPKALPFISGLLLAALLFLPHVAITLNHMQLGGVGEWLSKPGKWWIFGHLFFIFNRSWALILLTAALLALGIMVNHKNLKINKFHVICLIWFILPFITGFIYSRMVNPVLHDPVMIFALPFLLLLIFGFMPDKFNRITQTALIVYALAGAADTVFIGRYYSTQHFGEFRRVAEKIHEWNLRCGSDKVSQAVVANNPFYIDFYLKRYGPGVKYIQTDNKGHEDLLELKLALDMCNTPYFIYGWTKPAPAEIEDLIRVKYPYVIERQTYGWLSAITLFGRECYTGLCEETKPAITVLNDFEDKNTWGSDTSLLTTQMARSGQYAVHLDRRTEFGPTYRAMFRELKDWPLSRLRISCQAFVPFGTGEVNVVAEITDHEGKSYQWHSSRFANYLVPGQWGPVFLNILLKDIKSPTDRISVYVWNTRLGEVFIDDMKLEYYP